ncbi:predicted protein [Naegleria gruberi]|uniref:Predicted protein n=1 Tax=Naegleria gruberi TaxID=5762 RepID=D2VVZ9_NAEGR|nr:uncharacterized protein NAEGRDRAFT_73198 [Naegleria gruberi]EFC38928.1 predicted protein [Naegleria gruberi]|eukprot:XP_002671672.1 predicted protein [Naegleria gruberi strain NEG-M]
MKTKVAPNIKYETESVSSSSADGIDELKTTFFSSIKFLLIILISLLILISVVLLSVIWISSFSSAVGEMSSKVRRQEFEKIVSFTQRILNDVMLVTESVKSQLYSDFDFDTMIEKHMFKAMRVAQKYLPSVTQGVNIGDPFGAFYGLAHFGDEITFYNITPGKDQYYYNCRNFYTSDYCNRSSEPDIVYPPFTSNFVAESASVNPGNPVFTVSYVDPTLPNFVFLTAVSSFKQGNIKSGASFSYFFGYDMTVASISEFLVEITKEVSGSSSFIIEKKTDFIIASDHPEVAVATVDSQGNVQRKTANDFGGDVTKIGNIVYGAFKSFDELTCNTESVLSDVSNVISVYRLCTEEGLEWVLVFSVPHWNYIGSMVIAIICAILGSILIVSIAKTSCGQIGKFENEMVTIHFNATNDQNQHEMKGLQLCHVLLSKLNGYKERKLRKHQLLEKYKESSLIERFNFRIVANSQYNLCGNLGTKQVMTFSILGSTPFNLQSMIETAKELDVPILISDDLNEKVDNLFQTRYVDTKEMVIDQYYTSPVSDSNLFSMRRVYELGESSQIAQDEWM